MGATLAPFLPAIANLDAKLQKISVTAKKMLNLQYETKSRPHN